MTTFRVGAALKNTGDDPDALNILSKREYTWRNHQEEQYTTEGIIEVIHDVAAQLSKSFVDLQDNGLEAGSERGVQQQRGEEAKGESSAAGEGKSAV